MNKEFLESLHAGKRMQYRRLIELSDLTEQLAQAVERRDEVSTSMLISMRQQPLLELRESEETLRAGLLRQPEEDAIRLNALLTGGPVQEPVLEEENALREQVERNRRLLEKIAAVDKRVSTRMGGKRSFYNNFR